MGKIIFSIKDDVEKEFRRNIGTIDGYKRGVMSKIAEELIISWNDKYEKKNITPK